MYRVLAVNTSDSVDLYNNSSVYLNYRDSTVSAPGGTCIER